MWEEGLSVNGSKARELEKASGRLGKEITWFRGQFISQATKESKEMDMLNGWSCRQAYPVCDTAGIQQHSYSSYLIPQMWQWLADLQGSNALAAVGSCVALVGIFVNLTRRSGSWDLMRRLRI